MSKISYIDINRLNATDRESEETNTWTLDLNKNLSLPTGTEISIQQSFINQKGILGSSIEIEEDITEAVSSHFYLNDEFHPIGDQVPFKVRQRPNLYINAAFLFNAAGLFAAGTPTEYIESIYGATNPSPYRHLGGSGTPFILYTKEVDGGGNHIMKPVVITRTFTIKKGVYGINQIADLIRDQINGKVRLDTHTGEYIRTSAVETNVGNATFDGDISQGAGLIENLTLANGGVYNYNDTNNGTFTPANRSFTKFFIPNHEHRDIVNLFPNQEVQHAYDTYVAANKPILVLVDNQRARNTTQINNKDTEEPADYLNVDNYRLGQIGYKVGATEFNLTYNTERNGFEFSHLHQPYRPPTHDIFGNPIENAGTEAVGIPNFFREFDDPFPNPATSTGGTDQSQNRIKCISSVLSPLTRISGVVINNAAVETARKLSDLATAIPIAGCYLFKDYFSSEIEARKAWNKCIWSRLGFDYDQLNSERHFEKIATFNTNPAFLQGFTTNAEIDSTIQPSIAGNINPSTSFPSLGSATDGAVVTNIETFNFIDMGTPRRSAAGAYPDPKTQIYNNIKQFTGNVNSAVRTMLHITTTDRPLIGRKLPTLSLYGYYLITSNIVPNHDDIVAKGSPLPLLGVVPKTSLSSQDFIFTDNQITHTLTNPVNLNSIKVSVLNPDLTSPDLDDNSSVIFKIVSPVQE